MQRGAEVAAAAYRSFGQFLEHELLPLATPVDAVGREDYELHSRHFLGAVVDLDETYAWGIEELARMREEQERIADRIESGASVASSRAGGSESGASGRSRRRMSSGRISGRSGTLSGVISGRGRCGAFSGRSFG